MLKQLLIKLAVMLTILTAIWGGGAALSAHATTAKSAPSGRNLACAQIWLPPC